MFLTHRVPTGRLQRPLKGNQYGGLYTTGEVFIFIRVHTSASLGRLRTIRIVLDYGAQRAHQTGLFNTARPFSRLMRCPSRFNQDMNCKILPITGPSVYCCGRYIYGPAGRHNQVQSVSYVSDQAKPMYAPV